MDSKRSTNQTGQARGNLMRQERQLSQAKMKLESATRNRVVGGVILLIGVIVLFLVNFAIGVGVLVIGGWVFVRALRTINFERSSITTLNGRVTRASTRLDDLEAQPSVAD